MAQNTTSRLEKLNSDFSFLQNDFILGILLFGSSTSSEGRDTDICIVAPKSGSKIIMKKVYQNLDVTAKNYDVHCFEELPLFMKWQVIHNHKIIFAKDEGELYEYFYYYRKLEVDQLPRMQITKQEILGMI
ncbi:MAG: DNA polymerase subunit beta [Candidatus Micrarchaeota archaeon]